MADAKKKPAKKISDVAHPGKSAPSGNSKSVIVPTRPIMKDPMVVEESGSDDEDKKITVKTREAVVAPVGDAEIEKKSSEDKTELKAEDDKKTIAVLAEEAAVKKTESEEKKKADDEPEEKEDVPTVAPADESPDEKPISSSENSPKDDSGPGTDSVSDDGPSTKSVTEADEEELAAQEKHDAAIQKLIDSKQYELPINSVERRRSKRVVALGVILSILLVLLWVDIALDASLIQVDGIKPVTHFFSN